MDGKRYLVVSADDFAIGPLVSQGILDLARGGGVTCSVVLVNSPFAEEAVQSWRRTGESLELGWHPCLTLDRPVAAAHLVPTLVDPEGRFWRLGSFIRRLWLGRIRGAEIELELRAQYRRYCELIGRPPLVVNSHHHVQVFRPIGAILRQILAKQAPSPYVRRIREPWQSLVRVPGARSKRIFLSWLGLRDERTKGVNDFPGNDCLAGITDPPYVNDPDFLVRWLTRIPGKIVELTCHPGYRDVSLIGRDCQPGDGQLERRLSELHLLEHPSFREACRQAGFALVAPSQLIQFRSRLSSHAA